MPKIQPTETKKQPGLPPKDQRGPFLAIVVLFLVVAPLFAHVVNTLLIAVTLSNGFTGENGQSASVISAIFSPFMLVNYALYSLPCALTGVYVGFYAYCGRVAPLWPPLLSAFIIAAIAYLQLPAEGIATTVLYIGYSSATSLCWYLSQRLALRKRLATQAKAPRSEIGG